MCAFSTHAYGEMGSSRHGVNFILFQIHLTIIFLRLNAHDILLTSTNRQFGLFKF